MTLIKKFDVQGDDEKSLLTGILYYFKQNQLLSTLSAHAHKKYDCTKYPFDILDVESNVNFWTIDEINSSITFTFSSHKVKLTNYTLRGLDLGGVHKIACQSTHWLFQAFDINNKDWIVLDDHNGTELHGYSKIHNFPITQNFGIYSSFRIMQLDTNERNDHMLCLRNFELFGYLYSNENQNGISNNSLLAKLLSLHSIFIALLS